jgi:hypothetical protein
MVFIRLVQAQKLHLLCPAASYQRTLMSNMEAVSRGQQPVDKDIQFTMSSDFITTIPLEVDPSELTHLSSEIQHNGPGEEFYPRQFIAAMGIKLQAEMIRPIYIGTYKELPNAFELRPRFSFTGTAKKWMDRIQYAEITIVFEDAPESASVQPGPPPTVSAAAFYPKSYEGPRKIATVTDTNTITLDGLSMPGIGGLGGSTGRTRTYEKEDQMTIEASIPRGRNRNEITWVLTENGISRKGVPRSLELPIIVSPRSGRRFSAKVTVHAHYGIWRGPLAKTIPVLGKNDDPLFFDPLVLEEMAARRSRGFDRSIIVERAGILEDHDLDQIAIASFS